MLALDAPAAAHLRLVADQYRDSSGFYGVTQYESGNGSAGSRRKVVLQGFDGAQVDVEDALDDVDVVLMVLTNGEGVHAVETIGRACRQRSMFTAGIVIGRPGQTDAAVASLRPHAMVMIVSQDPTDVPDVLSALRLV